MRIHILRASFTILAVLWANVANAQGVSACAELLRYAGETFSARPEQEQYNAVSNWACEHTFSSENDARGFTSGAKFPIEGLPFEGHLNGNESQVRQQQRDFCSLSQEQRYSRYRNRVDIKTLNSAVTASVVACTKNLTEPNGFHARIEQQGINPRVFKVFLTTKGMRQPVTIDEFIITPASAARCENRPAARSTVDGAGREIVCSLAGDNPATITINGSVNPRWATAQTVAPPKVWSGPAVVQYPACNPGGVQHMSPANKAVLSGIVEIQGMHDDGAQCKVRLVTFEYDCDWGPEGPRWQNIASMRAPAPEPNGDVYYRAAFNADTAKSGHGTLVKYGKLCQLHSVITYEDGKVVDNSSGFSGAGR